MVREVLPVPGVTTAADLSQAEADRTIDEDTDRKKDAAKRYAFQAAQKTLKNEAFKRGMLLERPTT